MACILIGWELGAGTGHISAITPVIETLLGDGHEVHLAIQQIEAGGLNLDPRVKLWQSPVWPRLLGTRSRTFDAPPATMGDILGRLGLDIPGALAALIAGWDSILSAVRPELAIAEFAPALLSAARGRIATVRMGTGFAAPPAHLDRYPLLAGDRTQYSEERLLDIADADLRSTGREALTSLPALAAAGHDLVCSFAEFDAYAADRVEGYVQPGTPPSQGSENSDGQEVFCYFPTQFGANLPVWEGLAASNKPIRVHMPEASVEHVSTFRRLGFAFEPYPISFETIASRSRLVVSHGGHGFVTASALNGLPQQVIGYDLEKFVIGEAVAANGLGGYTNLFTLNPRDLGQSLADMHADERLADHCKGVARELAARSAPALDQRIAEIVDAL